MGVTLLHRIRAAALVVAVSAMGTYPAAGFELFGLTLFGSNAEADADAVIADPQPYSVEIEFAGDDSLRANVEAASVLFKDRAKPASGAAGLIALARTDYRHILSALYDQSRFGAAIAIRIDGREAANLPPDANLSANPLVIIAVDPGPAFALGTVQIDNQADPLPDSLTLKTGTPASATRIRQTARALVNQWRERGYAMARVGTQDIVADHHTSTVNVHLSVETGPVVSLGAINVDGPVDVKSQFILRQAGLVPGRTYSPSEIAAARRKLADLQVFDVVQIEESEELAADGTLPLTIVVKERAPRRVGIGATFSSADGLGVETFFLHRNLLGEAERLRLDAKLAGIGYPLNTAAFDYYFGGTFTNPGVVTPDTDIIASLIAQRTVLTRYTETSAEGKLGFTHDLTPQLQAAFGVEAKHARFVDAAHGTRDFSLVGTYAGLTFDSRDNSTDPSEGIFANLMVAPYYETNFNASALLLTGEARTYFALDPEDRFILAGRVKVGALLGPPVAQTPPDKLFFAGGGGSVRGFPYRSIGVSTPGGVTGGKFLTEASVEARLKMSDSIGVVGFVDAGYVTDTSFVGLAQGTRVGVGAGVRYYTGLGPLRLDLALPVNPRPGDPYYALYIGIGQAF